MKLRRVELNVNGPVCAPYAIEAVTGVPLEQHILRDRRGHVRGLYNIEIGEALRKAGADPTLVAFPRWMTRPTVAEVASWGGVGVLSTKNHAMALNGGLLNDTFSKRWIWPWDHSQADRLVQSVRYTSPVPRQAEFVRRTERFWREALAEGRLK